MKKVLFLMRYPLDDDYNLKLKFNGQMRACVNLGYDVYYIGYDASSYYLCNVNSGEKQATGRTHFYKYKNYRSTFAFFDLYSALASVLKNRQFDFIYMRNKPVTSRAVSALKKHKSSGGKLIVEIPSYGVNEASLSFARRLIYRLSKKSKEKFRQLADLYTLIGNDCPDTYNGKPAMEIVNGVSLETIPMKKQNEIGSEIHILALASMRDWHGFDRVIRGISSCSADEKLILHLVGQDLDGSVQKWLSLAGELNVSSNVIYHGALYDNQLNEMFDMCHLAVGSMAFHRIGATTGSTLKVREYIARGIPFIYGYEDSALDGTEWFAIRFPADESPVDFDRVIPLIKNIYTNRDAVKEIRRFASENLSWEKQLRPVFTGAEEA